MKIYCIFFDTTPLFPELLKIAKEKEAFLLYQVSNCCTVTTAAEVFTGKKPSDLMENGIGHLSHEQYWKAKPEGGQRVQWPWHKELLMEKLSEKGWEIRYHNSIWFTLIMGIEKLKTTWTISSETNLP